MVRTFFGAIGAFNADFIFIHREAMPVGPPVVEWMLARILRKKIIYDFDDAIWLTDNAHESMATRRIRWRQKVSTICKWSHRISAGNTYLASYALQFNTRVVLNPTTLDTDLVHRRSRYPKVTSNPAYVTIGWTGTHSTLKYLEQMEVVLKLIEKKYPQVAFLVISNKAPGLELERLTFKPWRKKTEIDDLLAIDIGVMPLPDDPWSKGKCGFKALQYMALEIPAVVSPVGVNLEIIQNGKNGYLCATDDEWIATLGNLIEDTALRQQIGLAGRQTVVDRFSVSSNSSNFLSLFE